MLKIEKIQNNIKCIKQELGSSQTLVAISKYRSYGEVREALNAQQLDFGENRVGELVKKANHFSHSGVDNIVWHFVGHLQSNKVRTLLKIPNLYYIHSVDSLKLFEQIHADIDHYLGEKLKIFLQINTSNEKEKQGFLPEEFEEIAQTIFNKDSTRIELSGLMTMGNIRGENFLLDAQKCFEKLLEIKTKIKNKYNRDLMLSMGMSGDYKLALKLTSNFIRVGAGIFGPRPD